MGARSLDGRPETSSGGSRGAGIAFTVGAYALWGFLPLFFLALLPSEALEIVSWRILLSLVFCAILITVTRRWNLLVKLVRDRRTTLILGLAGIFILINWLIYVFAVQTDQVVEAALGYFANPIVTVLLGVFVLRERLRSLQWVSLAISALAVLILAITYGRFPWIALGLAFSFGLYGLIKKQVGGRADALSGLSIETAWLAPLATVVLLVIAASGTLTIGLISPLHTTLLLSAGVVTAVPLLLFASAARRVPLSYLGLLQFLEPVLQFVIGVVFLHEQMPLARWLGFGLIWLALVLITADMLRNSRTARRALPVAE